MEGAGSGAEEGRGRAGVVPPLPGGLARRNPSLCPSLAEAGTLYLYFSAPKSGNEEAWGGSAVGWMENQRFQAGFCSVHDEISRASSFLCLPMECDVPWGSSPAGGDITPFLGCSTRPSHSCSLLLSHFNSQRGGG